MATEVSRETSVRKIKPRSYNGPTVKLKVIDKINFIDPKEQYQEYEYSFNNTPTSSRITESYTVGPSKLECEQIKDVGVIDSKSQYQESIFTYLMRQEGTHLETHKTKVYATDANGKKDEDLWVEVERVDKIRFIDPKTQYQEYIFQLNWNDIANPDWDYTGLSPVITDYDGTSINPPWRIDPFQRIVDASFSDKDYLIVNNWISPNLYAFTAVEFESPVKLRISSADINGQSLDGKLVDDYLGGKGLINITDLDLESFYIDLAKAREYQKPIKFEILMWWEILPSTVEIQGFLFGQPVKSELQLVRGGKIEEQTIYVDYGGLVPDAKRQFMPVKPEKVTKAYIYQGNVATTQTEPFTDQNYYVGQRIAGLEFNQFTGKWKIT